MSNYVWRDGCFRDKKTGEPMGYDPAAKPPRIAAVIKDIEPHIFRGRHIRSREDQRDLRRRDGFVPYEPVGAAIGMPDKPYSDRDDKWGAFIQDTKRKVAESAGLDAKTLETEAAARKVFGSTREKLIREGKMKPAPAI
jgi:hypothetical protein